MNKRTLGQDLRDHYLDHQLSPETAERLRDLAVRVDHRRARDRSRWWLAAAAIAFLVAGLAGWWNRNDHFVPGIGERVATEIAMNHSKHLAVEFASTSYLDLQSHMTKLDFELVVPASGETVGLELVGGRYCSIAGQLAAQLQLATADGDRITVYQTADTDELLALDERQTTLGEVVIEVWRQDGVVLGSARTRH